MKLSADQRRLCEQVVNVFETGKAEGDYGLVTILKDGPHRIRQITYGRSQTTEYGNLRDLVARYVRAGGTYSADLKPFAGRVGTEPLVDDDTFKALLRKAGRDDPVMKKVQDAFFRSAYFKPALKWAAAEGFREPLSALVIYDSFIHSGGIPWVVRGRFAESPPSKGGNERSWVAAYVKARRQWLASHPNPLLHVTVYRMKCFEDEMARGNWDLAQRPIRSNGVAIR